MKDCNDDGAHTRPALDYVEDACARHRLKAVVQPKSWVHLCLYRPNILDGAGATTSDARWFEVNSDIEAAIRHFGRSVELFRRGGFDAARLDGYQAAMALMHSPPSAPASLKGALVRVLAILREERPVGENWHANLIKRVAAALPGRRPPILQGDLVAAAEETRRFRHRASHNDDSFEVRETTRTIRAAELLAAELRSAIERFRNIIDRPAANSSARHRLLQPEAVSVDHSNVNSGADRSRAVSAICGWPIGRALVRSKPVIRRNAAALLTD